MRQPSASEPIREGDPSGCCAGAKTSRIDKLNAINETINSLGARYRGSPLPAFFEWWGKELSGVVPASLRGRMVAPRPAIWLVPGSDDTSFLVWKASETPEQVDELGGEEDINLLRDRWREILASFEDGSPEIRLCLPGERVLEKPVELPLAVEGNLAPAVGYQLDQLTPFTVNQVYYDFRVTERDSEHGRLRLDLRLVLRHQLEVMRDRLATLGIRPHAIDTLAIGQETPRCEGFNLMPEAERPPYVFKRARLNWMLAGAAVLVLAIVMAQSVVLRERGVDRLEREVAQLRGEAETVMALQRELEDSLQAANFLADRRRNQPVVIQVLDEVSRVLPNDMWLQQVQIRATELQIMGLADGSQRLIEILNDSPLLDDAAFRGSINVDPATGQERFNATATIIPRGVQHAVASGSGE
ncbi:MAG: PilN domain-containing protein [Wenzhouxiangella sp.]